MIRVSVIIPVYNGENTIGECLESLLHQSFRKEAYEIIVVDDGSTDVTPAIVRQFPVRYFRQPNQGPATARNKGAQEAEGEIILFTDADCIPQNNWVEEMVRSFNDPKVMAVKGSYKTNQKALTARFAQIEFEERFEMLRRRESIDMVDTYSAGYRKSVFLSLGGFDPSFPVANNEDTELSYKMSQAGHKMVFNSHAVVYHLNHPDSIKKYARLKFWRGYWRMVVYKKYPQKMLKDSYTPQTLKLQILFLFLFLMFLPLMLLLPDLMFFPQISALILFLLFTMPFIKSSLRKDLAVASLSPFFLCLRAASLGFGIIWGVMSPNRLTKDEIRPVRNKQF